jgi:hypothetical protein
MDDGPVVLMKVPSTVPPMGIRAGQMDFPDGADDGQLTEPTMALTV